MKTFTAQELKNILDLHSRWLNGKEGGVRAHLSDANLFRANLSGVDLSGAYLARAFLAEANLSGANLYGADLSAANLSRANLSGANLSGANLSIANLSGALLPGAILYGANLAFTDLVGLYLGKHFAFYQPETDYLKIGCHGMSLDDWKNRYQEIGEKEGYSKSEIDLYGFTINEYLPKMRKIK